ncbi:MAG: hypothetical protein ACQETE_11570 [Bacteroidota bacterium]
MAETQQPKSDDDAPSMSIVKWIIIIAIGIPVLIEVGTFAGMFVERLSGEEQHVEQHTEDLKQLVAGSHIELEEDVEIRVDTLKVWASSGDWIFQMTLSSPEHGEAGTGVVILDQLTTNNDEVLEERKRLQLPLSSPQTIQWRLPSGQQPFSIRIITPNQTGQVLEFGKIPVRMQQ